MCILPLPELSAAKKKMYLGSMEEIGGPEFLTCYTSANNSIKQWLGLAYQNLYNCILLLLEEAK